MPTRPMSVDVGNPTCVVVALLLVMICGVHLGRAIANVVAGADWVFPERADLFRSLPAVLRSDAGLGIDGLDKGISSSTAPWTYMAATELILLILRITSAGVRGSAAR